MVQRKKKKKSFKSGKTISNENESRQHPHPSFLSFFITCLNRRVAIPRVSWLSLQFKLIKHGTKLMCVLIKNSLVPEFQVFWKLFFRKKYTWKCQVSTLCSQEMLIFCSPKKLRINDSSKRTNVHHNEKTIFCSSTTEPLPEQDVDKRERDIANIKQTNQSCSHTYHLYFFVLSEKINNNPSSSFSANPYSSSTLY